MLPGEFVTVTWPTVGEVVSVSTVPTKAPLVSTSSTSAPDSKASKHPSLSESRSKLLRKPSPSISHNLTTSNGNRTSSNRTLLSGVTLFTS